MVSTRDIQCYIDDYGYPGTWLTIRKDCNSSIRLRKLPKFVIANGFFMGNLHAWRVICESDEESVVERRVGLMNASSHLFVRDHPAVVEVEGVPQSERVFLVRRSDKFANDIAGDLFAKLFPHLFPFGRGHTGERRGVAVSVKECVKYSIALSERKFAVDELFYVRGIRCTSLQNMFIHNSFRCKGFPHIYEGYENISGEQLNPLATNFRTCPGRPVRAPSTCFDWLKVYAEARVKLLPSLVGPCEPVRQPLTARPNRQLCAL
ncbi:Hypothetical protein PHPALM_11795 [Phytophthora palmivora]|uniref:Uncharacterized protein n=1 Tax=Phytophthora palmivora TaxID=4796 RepID=A0A2P4Y1L6_9STRA|nr:Hypothetical protein PHPALM_11795 [Phytophthora palmivora]